MFIIRGRKEMPKERKKKDNNNLLGLVEQRQELDLEEK
jgi:hypothetical protein